MIGVNRLFDISENLVRDEALVAPLKSYLESIFKSKSYQDWLNDAQYLGYRSIHGKPLEPHEAGKDNPGGKFILAKHGLSAGGRLEVKVDRHRDRIHVTDGFFVPPTDRIFPTCDESEIVCRFIEENIEIHEESLLIDPACGCGHHALGLSTQFARRVSLDISGRALAFARLNSILNSDTKHALGFGDVRSGIPLEYTSPPGSHTVFAVNMPFAIDPKDHWEQSAKTLLSQDGGDRGIQLTFAVLDAIGDFQKRNSGSSIDAVVLCYTLGRYDEGSGIGSWEVVDYAEDEKLWRVNGIKSQSNPMHVSNMELKAECRNTYSDHLRENKKSGYNRLAKGYIEAGYTHLGYGVLHVRLK
jgi:hypothetical protein